MNSLIINATFMNIFSKKIVPHNYLHKCIYI